MSHRQEGGGKVVGGKRACRVHSCDFAAPALATRPARRNVGLLAIATALSERPHRPGLRAAPRLCDDGRVAAAAALHNCRRTRAPPRQRRPTMSAICHRDQTSRPRRLVLAALSSLLVSLPAVLQAQGLPTVKPDEVGLSSQRLAGIGSWLRAEVAQKKIPGGHRGRARRQGRLPRCRRTARPRQPGTDEGRRHLPHLLDDQAHRQRRRADAGRRGPTAAGRPCGSVYPGLRQRQGGHREDRCERSEDARSGAAAAADDGAGPMRHTRPDYGFFGRHGLKLYVDNITTAPDIRTPSSPTIATMPLAYQPGSM